MTTEDKALALLNEVSMERGLDAHKSLRREAFTFIEAICRAIEQHEAFRQEVSDAILRYLAPTHVPHGLKGFIIPKPKPDPLVEVLEKMGWYIAPNGPTDAENFRAALDALGFEIREKNDGHS